MFRKTWFVLALIISALLALIIAPVAFAQEGDPIEGAEDLAAWASITGILLPIVIAAIIRFGWTAQTKMIAAVILAVIDAIVVTGLTHGWHFDGHLLATVAAVLGLSQVTYRNIWLKFGDSSTEPGEPGPEVPPEAPLIKRFEKATG